MQANHIKILYGLIALLFCALAGMSFYILQRPQISAQPQAYTPGTVSDATTSNALAGITVGGGSSNLYTKIGTITQIGSNSMQIKDSASGGVYTISITSTTKVQLLGVLKDPAEYQKEVAAYNAQVNTLMQDPQKNKAALAAMRLPSAQEMSSITLADLKVGDSVMVEANTMSGSSYVADTIFKSTPQ